jgi:hypothetical protein
VSLKLDYGKNYKEILRFITGDKNRMALTRGQVTDILRKLQITYTHDAFDACYASGLESRETVEKWWKAAFYVAEQENRSIVTAVDVNKVLPNIR